jgi:hypothetical protein
MGRLLEEAGVELWVDEDPRATFSSALPNVFGLPDSAEPSEEQTEADSSVRTQAMLHLIVAARSEDLIRRHALMDTPSSHAICVCCVTPQAAASDGDGQAEEEEPPAQAPTYP